MTEKDNLPKRRNGKLQKSDAIRFGFAVKIDVDDFNRIDFGKTCFERNTRALQMVHVVCFVMCLCTPE